MSNYGHIKPIECPVCGNVNDDATCLETPEQKPEPGDFTICAKCGEIMVFTDDLSTKAADLDDMLTLTPQHHEYLDGLQKFIRKERIVG